VTGTPRASTIDSFNRAEASSVDVRGESMAMAAPINEPDKEENLPRSAR
jgi:hypothetical protein